MDILISDLIKRYKNCTVLDIDKLRIASGEIVGLMGNNGAGKSTFLKGVLDLIKIDNGTILINGLVNSKFDSWKESTSSFLGNDFLIDFLTPLEYFHFVGNLYGLSTDKIAAKIDTYTDFFDPYSEKEKLIKNLSSGNKQKVGIIGALIPDCNLLLFDEPYVYLDPSSQLLLTKIFRKLKEEEKTVIISSHDFFYLNEFCTRLIFIMKGIIVKDTDTINCSLEDMKSFFKVESVLLNSE